MEARPLGTPERAAAAATQEPVTPVAAEVVGRPAWRSLAVAQTRKAAHRPAGVAGTAAHTRVEAEAQESIAALLGTEREAAAEQNSAARPMAETARAEGLERAE